MGTVEATTRRREHDQMMRRPVGRRALALRLSLIAMAVVLGAGAAPAAAVVTIGAPLPPTSIRSAECEQSQPCVLAQTASPGRTYQAPFNGVIVRWRAMGVGPALLRVVAPNNTARGLSVPMNLGDPGVVFMQPSRVRIAAGELIGVEKGGVMSSISVARNPGATIAAWRVPFASGETRSPDTRASALLGRLFVDVGTGHDLLINSDIEPDVDGDGYGDESQDACPTDAATQGACTANFRVQAKDAPDPVRAGRSVTYRITLTNASPNPVLRAGLTASVRGRVSAVVTRVTATRRGCRVTATRRSVQCDFASLPPRAAVGVSVRARPARRGRLTMTARAVRRSLPDPRPASDVATVRTAVARRAAAR